MCKGLRVNSDVGTQYTYLAIKRRSHLHILHVVGKWNDQTCREFWKKVAKRFVPATTHYKFNVCTDANKQNLPALQEVFPAGAINYGKVKKIRKDSAVLGSVAKNVLGCMSQDEIAIRHMDGYCKKLRERFSRYCRRSSAFSKKRTPMHYHLCLFQAYNNFIEIYKEKQTPCMIEGLTSQKWDWDDIFMKFYHSK